MHAHRFRTPVVALVVTLVVVLVAALLVGLVSAPASTASPSVDVGASRSVSAAESVGPTRLIASPGTERSRYQPPVTPLTVVRPFDHGLSRYGPGHRGVDLALSAGAVVLAAGAGVVTFSGSVAGSGIVVVRHPDGIRTTYEPVRPEVSVGATVALGQVIAVLDGAHAGCPASCLHWGARRGDVYIDPLSLLHPLGVVRLIPWL